MKRAFVPTALHNELTEYTSLVRVLRTTRTLDLTTHLLHHAAQHNNDNDDDKWTSWPLIDCTVPEWSLADEIHQLGETVVRAQTDACDSDHDSDSGTDIDPLPPAAANRLVLHTGALLAHILNLLADQRPSTPGSMQNRLCPMNWEDVISLLGVSGVVNSTIVARAQQRLERIYGPSSTKAVQRLQSVASAKARYASLMTAVEEDQLLACPVLSRTHRIGGKDARKEVAVKSRPLVESDAEA